MGYTPFSKLNIRRYSDRKNPVVSITIPFNLIKELKWGEGNIIMFQKYKSNLTSSINLINLNKSSKKYLQPMLFDYPHLMEDLRKKRLQIFNTFPKNKIREAMEGWYYNKKYEKSDKAQIKRLNSKEKEIEENLQKKELEFLKKEELKLFTEILNISNRFPYLKLRLKEIQDQIKQKSSS